MLVRLRFHALGEAGMTAQRCSSRKSATLIPTTPTMKRMPQVELATDRLSALSLSCCDDFARSRAAENLNHHIHARTLERNVDGSVRVRQSAKYDVI